MKEKQIQIQKLKKLRKKIKEIPFDSDADMAANADVSVNTQQVTNWVYGLNISDKNALQCTCTCIYKKPF